MAKYKFKIADKYLKYYKLQKKKKTAIFLFYA